MTSLIWITCLPRSYLVANAVSLHWAESIQSSACNRDAWLPALQGRSHARSLSVHLNKLCVLLCESHANAGASRVVLSVTKDTRTQMLTNVSSEIRVDLIFDTAELYLLLLLQSLLHYTENGYRNVCPVDLGKAPKDQDAPLHNRWHPDIPPVSLSLLQRLQSLSKQHGKGNISFCLYSTLKK